MSREPTWAYQYGRDESSRVRQENSLPRSIPGSSRGAAGGTSPSLYESLSSQPGQGQNINDGGSSFMNNYAGNSSNNGVDQSRGPQSPPSFNSGIGISSEPNIMSKGTAPQNTVVSTIRSLIRGDRQNITIWDLSKAISVVFLMGSMAFIYLYPETIQDRVVASAETDNDFRRPQFVYEHPFVSSSYYSHTSSEKTLLISERKMQEKEIAASAGKGRRMNVKTRLAIVRPFCEFDAEALPSTFACWDALVPCKTALNDLGDLEGMANSDQNRSTWNTLSEASADLFLFYSQSFKENAVALGAVDSIIDTFNEPGGWSQCFDNVYAIEANIPQELDLYIPSAQEELYNWVNGPNRQFEAAFRIIQSGEWGDYDAFYLMESDSIPVKTHWLDQVLHKAEENRPFAILGAKYNGDKWDNFYESIPLSLLHHINGNAIYNTSHPLLERLVGQLEIEAPCPYNSIPYDYRMSQMVVEGALQIVPKLAPKIMLNEEGENITLSNNTEMFTRWWDMYKDQNPFKETYVIHNYAATNLIPRHLGPEYIIHGAKLYSPWDPTRAEVTLVISEWFFDRSTHLLSHLDKTDHPFSRVVVMLPPDIMAHESYNMTVVPVTAQHRIAPDFMDLCEAKVETDYFMVTNSYHHVATHVDLMFTPGTFKPVTAFTPSTYPFCFKFPYCKETINLAQRFNPGHDKVVQDFDMLYTTKHRNKFCEEWKERWGFEGEDLYKNQKKRLMVRGTIIGPKGPTGTAYTAYLFREGLDKGYKFTDRSLYGARDAFIKVFAKEEKLDGMTEDELAKRVGVTASDNSTDCDCKSLESQATCEGSPLGCIWRPLFESCRPPEMIDDGTPICPQTSSPTMSPTVFYEFDETMDPTASPTKPPTEPDPWYASLFKTREHAVEADTFEEEYYEEEYYDEEVVEGEEVADGVSSDAPTPFFSEKTREHDNSTEDDSLTDESGRRRTEVISDGRRLNVLSFEDSDFAPSPSPIIDVQRELYVAAKLAYDRNNSITEELYVPDFENAAQAANYYLAPSTSPANGMEACPTWGPSIVKRKKSRKRKRSPFHDHFVNNAIPRRKLLASASEAYFKTSNGNIIVPSLKPGFIHESPVGTKGLTIPNIKHTRNQPLDASYIKITNYKDRHPFEGGGLGSMLLGGNGDSDPFNNIRLKFDTTFLEDKTLLQGDSSDEERKFAEARVDAILREILPSVAGIYAEALKVVPVFGNLFPASSECGAINIPASHMENGIENSDIVIYVSASNKLCSNEPSHITACNFDQHMRPIVGNLEICLNEINLDDQDSISREEMLDQISYYTVEVGKLLGLSPNLFQFFRNPDTGRPWGTSTQTVTCVDGSEQTLDLPHILSAGTSIPNKGRPTFEVISPTVLQVVRNHFDCQTMSGAALESSDSSWSCFGSNWEKRLFFDEDLTSGSSRGYKSFMLSPLTLALFEDSSWYKADYSKATSSAFGHGAGCGFVEGDCIVDGEVPSYSKGFFCNAEASDSPSGCDYTHSMRASCNTSEGNIPFENAVGSGSFRSDANYCPMMSTNFVSCSEKSSTPTYDFEVYGSNSKCFETNTAHSICLEAICNQVDRKVEFMISEEIYQCDYDGQTIEIDDNISIECPRIAAVCPDMICPSSCSGRGVCDYCLEVPQCICDDPFDNSPGCWGSQGW